jgi:hypothetical protein
VSPDEATPNFNQLIDNMHVGHEFLWKEFKVIPTTAWFVDEFGHSAANVVLLS